MDNDSHQKQSQVQISTAELNKVHVSIKLKWMTSASGFYTGETNDYCIHHKIVLRVEFGCVTAHAAGQLHWVCVVLHCMCTSIYFIYDSTCMRWRWMCVCEGLPDRVCWSDVNDVSCHVRESAFSGEKGWLMGKLAALLYWSWTRDHTRMQGPSYWTMLYLKLQSLLRCREQKCELNHRWRMKILQGDYAQTWAARFVVAQCGRIYCVCLTLLLHIELHTSLSGCHVFELPCNIASFNHHMWNALFNLYF